MIPSPIAGRALGDSTHLAAILHYFHPLHLHHCHLHQDRIKHFKLFSLSSSSSSSPSRKVQTLYIIFIIFVFIFNVNITIIILLIATMINYDDDEIKPMVIFIAPNKLQQKLYTRIFSFCNLCTVE